MKGRRVKSQQRNSLRSLAVVWLALVAACSGGDHDELELWRGVNAMSEGRWQAARAFFEADLEQRERLESVRYAAISWSEGRLQSGGRAVAYFRRFLAVEPGDVGMRRRLVRMLLLLGDFEPAAVEAAALDDSAASNRLRAVVQRELDLDAAREAIDRALEQQPAAASGHATAATIYDALGEFELARHHAERAVALAPLDARSRYLAGRLQARLGASERATETLRLYEVVVTIIGQGSTTRPAPTHELRLLGELAGHGGGSSPATRLRIASLLLKTGQHAAAREELELLADAPELTPENWLGMGKVATESGARALAGTLYQRVIDRYAPPAPAAGGDRWLDSAPSREARFRLALLAVQEGDRAEARRLISSGLRELPQAGRWLCLRGALELADGGGESAVRNLADGLRYAPWRDSCRIDLVSVHLARGEREEARELLAAAPEPSAALERLRVQHAL